MSQGRVVFEGTSDKLRGEEKIRKMSEFKQSILQKAFLGELTSLPEKTVEEAVA